MCMQERHRLPRISCYMYVFIKQISDKYSSSLVKFKGRKWTWIRPTTFEQLVGLKQDYPDAPVIMGNTTAGRIL